jgi:hypothetical protein
MFLATVPGLPHQEALDVPPYEVFKDFVGYSRSQPIRFRLTSEDYNHEVQVLRRGYLYHNPAHGYGFTAFVCPIETVDTTKQGTRCIQVAVDTRGKATWI